MRNRLSCGRNSRLIRLEQVQLDGDLDPGNSGGPIVDVDGRVAGVAVATVLTTKISFMIPAGGVRRFLEQSQISRQDWIGAESRLEDSRYR